MAVNTDNPAAPSSAYEAMRPAWELVDDIRAGIDRVRAAGKRHLPQYEEEDEAEYRRRLSTAPWRPEFNDALRSLVSKPFSKDVALQGSISQRIADIAEDVDTRGNSLTVFARSLFEGGIADGMGAILVDYPQVGDGITLAQERASGARPYWVSIPARSLIAVYTDIIDGKETVTHARIRERSVEREGFGEKTIDRVRVLEPGRWELWQAETTGAAGPGYTSALTKVAEGRSSLGYVPLVLYYVGERDGAQIVRPPLIDLAHMQIELYQAMSRKDEVLTFAASPMLCGSGFVLEGDQRIPVGPKRVLYAPPDAGGSPTSWSYISPDAANIGQIREDIRDLIADMRRLGMQPLTQQAGGITATATSVESAKAHSALQTWAVGLKDALEQALAITADWLGEKIEAEVFVDTDFVVGSGDSQELTTLQSARTSRDISRDTYWDELRRRGILGPQFDKAVEADRLAKDDERVELTGDPLELEGAKNG
ncbi:hypothetical protein FHS82_001043 [Pseudochelatococcus lubricantis]|uniref:DUF4055 domain-containing protein n=1 Tax=Pseudochelatococcus lubricantis TaxID=1538102 RepID=A0ABX0UW88_9HYPH|nr:DUF4055 domain-containing protein [Pseudochelatococcus lubricantis]NIJ57217.1 hypothetical protein [Pseudochelatococcus lubricantis]